MSTEGYAAFLREMGHTVRESAGVFWFDAHPRVYMSFPFQTPVEVSALELPRILGSDGWVARFPCPLEQGRASYRVIVDDPAYDLGALTGKARNQTRRGLEHFAVRPVAFSELAQAGPLLNRETLNRQGRSIPRNFESYWQRYYASAGRAQGAAAWGAFAGERLAAYLIAFHMDQCAHVLIVRSGSEDLKHYPNNALIFTFVRTMLSEGQVREVSIGLETIQADMDSLDHFKLGLGFRQQPLGQRIELRTPLNWMLRGPLGAVAQRLAHLGRRDERLAKLEGLLAWYREQPFHLTAG
ncbi:MAG: GNAT family N-acetyltransferase [Deltaproteobacteria bacterium]|nr:GNAT family N-acetyltransferase [Deltaproteobacteria bacterium]